jgi:hypothetical protein
MTSSTESGLVRIRVVVIGVVFVVDVADGAADEVVECVLLKVLRLKGFFDGVSSGEVGTKYEGVSESESSSSCDI